MYYISGDSTIKVDRTSETTFCRRSRKTITKSLKPERISAIPTENYKSYLDQRIEQPTVNLPAVVKKEDLPLEPGKLYQLMTSRVYKLEKIVNTEDGINANIVSVYNGKLDKGKKALSEEECERLGIEFKEGLYPLNPGMKLMPFDPNEKEYIPDDLSTYPTSLMEGSKNSIRHMILCLSGFSRTTDSEIIQTPGGAIIDVELFIATFKVSMRDTIPPLSGYTGWLEDEELSWSFISDNFKGSERVTQGELCDTNGKIYLIVKLTKNGIGISPYSLKNKTAGDIFKVTWDSSFAVEEGQDTTQEKVENSSIAPRFDRNIFIKDKGNMYWRAIEPSLKNGLQKCVPLVMRI